MGTIWLCGPYGVDYMQTLFNCALQILLFFFFFNRIKIWGNPAWGKSTSTIFPTASAHFLSLCHSILTIFQTSSLLPFTYLFWSYHEACGILVPWPGVEPAPPALEVQSLKHWTAKKSLVIICLLQWSVIFGVTTTTPWRLRWWLTFFRNKVKVTQSCPALWDPMDYTVYGILQAKNTGVGSRSLLQGIFPTYGSNSGLLHSGGFFTSWATREAF